MAPLSSIRSVLAGFFLLLFAFSITPKRTLHNLVANHKDSRAAASVTDPFQSQLGKAGLNCQCDNLISESPFVSEIFSSSTVYQPVFISYADKLAVGMYSTDIFCYGFRGPPAC